MLLRHNTLTAIVYVGSHDTDKVGVVIIPRASFQQKFVFDVFIEGVCRHAVLTSVAFAA